MKAEDEPMHFVTLKEAAATLSAKKAEIEAKRKELFESQTPEFQTLKKANANTTANKHWSVMFIVLWMLNCFVINAVISFTIFFILEFTIYANEAAVATQATRAMRILASTLTLPALSVLVSLIHNYRCKDTSPNQARLALIHHPDYAIWSELDGDLKAELREINDRAARLTNRGLLYIDGEQPANPDAVMGVLYVNGSQVADLTYAEMPYEFHADEGIYRVAVKQNDDVLFERDVTLRHAYVVTLDLTVTDSKTQVDAQNMVRHVYHTEREKMSRKGTVYTAQD
jgi:hypothetical protein